MDRDLHQLLDPKSSTFTYFLVDRASREAIAIDSVDTQVERDLALVKRLDLHLPRPKMIDVAGSANQNLGIPHAI